MVNENFIYLEDIKTYSTELLEYVKYGFIINDEILKEIISTYNKPHPSGTYCVSIKRNKNKGK